MFRIGEMVLLDFSRVPIGKIAKTKLDYFKPYENIPVKIYSSGFDPNIGIYYELLFPEGLCFLFEEHYVKQLTEIKIGNLLNEASTIR